MTPIEQRRLNDPEFNATYLLERRDESDEEQVEEIHRQPEPETALSNPGNGNLGVLIASGIAVAIGAGLIGLMGYIQSKRNR